MKIYEYTIKGFANKKVYQKSINPNFKYGIISLNLKNDDIDCNIISLYENIEKAYKDVCIKKKAKHTFIVCELECNLTDLVL
jgi:hypothetical protein